jgi:Mycolic acid cyclopropane synthetase
MSSKGRAAADYKADPHGFFETQSVVTRAAMSYLGIKPGMRILQCGCGNGAIAKVLRTEYGRDIEIIGVEIDKGRAKKADRANAPKWIFDDALKQPHAIGGYMPVFDEVVHMDFFKYAPEKRFDLVIENPSFSIWLPVAEHCFKLADRTTLLIPWNSAASMERAPWWAEHKSRLRVLSRRPSFAISVKCEMSNARHAAEHGLPHCSYQELIALSAKPKKKCPKCGNATKTTRSDSNEYCWANWGPDITQNTWDPLETPDPHPDDQ